MDQKQFTRLVERSRSGDRAAQEELIAAVQNLVYFHCCKLVGDREAALDLTQEILIAMVTGLPKLQEPAAFRTWLLKIVYSRCKNHWRRSPKECQIPETEDGDSLMDTWADDDIETIPDQALDRSETVRVLRELVDGLTPEQRTCVLLYYYDELKVSEIASVLSVPETTVKSRLFHARKALRDGILRQERRTGGLYSLALAPLMGWMLRSEADAGALPAAEGASLTASTLSSAASAAGTAAAATSVVGTIAKITVCVAVIGATVGGVWTLRDLRRTKPPEVETAETGNLDWDPADAAAWETRLAQDETFLKNFDSLTDDPMIDIGRGWRDDQGRLHLEYRNYSSYFWSLREVVLEGDEDDWTICSDGPAEGLYVTEDPQGRLLTDQEDHDIFEWLHTTSAPIRTQFLTSDFRTPEEISFYDVFYNGDHPNDESYPDTWEIVPDAEQIAALGYVSHLDVSKSETGEMDRILREESGVSMADCYGYGLGKFQYVPQYDAYYSEHGDTNDTVRRPWKGWMLEDGSVCLWYLVRDEPYEVKLAPHGEGWQFVYNRPLLQQMAVNEEAMQDLSKLAEPFVTSTVLMPAEIAGAPFTFDTPSDLTDDQLLRLFLMWTDYAELEACQEADGMFYFQEPMIRRTLDRYFKEYEFDITQLEEYDAHRQAVVLPLASGFGGGADVRIVDTQVEGNVVTYTVDFHGNLYSDGRPGTYVGRRQIYEIEYYLGGWYYLSSREVPVE